MTRKLALVVAACLGLFHQAAWALGLGDIDVESALNQPFSATIELRNTGTLERNEIIANLASVEDFERVGVERFFFLSDLAFETDLSDPRTPVLRVSSNQPITEPFVNFVVEVLWPSGRLLKEFTILLDPPTYAARPLEAPQAPATTGAIRTRPEPAPAPAPARAEAPAGSGTGTGTLTGDSYGVTDRNDTLWDIALKVRPDRSLSVHQTMLALLRLNPEAFIGNNINQLKAGYVLRVPSADEVRRLSRDDAIIQVAEQNDRWRSGLDRAPLDARDRGAGAQRRSGSGGELRLVSGTEDAAASGTRRTGEGGTSAPAAPRADDSAVQAELATARTQLDATRRENETLRGEVQSAASERQELQRQIELKNEQIARLQAAVQEQLATQSSAPPSAPATRAPAAAGGLFGFSWLVIGAAVGGILLLGVIVLLVLRRLSSGSEEGAAVAPFDTAEPELPIEAEAGDGEAEPASELPLDDLDGDDVEHGAAAEEDVLAEADVYMAYGNFSEAAAALGAALEADPNRADIRLKLLEVHVEQGDVDAFNEQAFALQSMADDATIAEADRLAARLPGAATSTGEITSGEAAPAPREASEGGVSLDFDLALDDAGNDAPADLDSLDIDLDLDDDGASSGEDTDFGLDFDSADDTGADADLGATVATDASSESDGAEDDFELAVEGGELGDDDSLPDLDFDLEDDEPPASGEGVGAAAPTADAEDVDFDIDALDEGQESGAPAVTSETAPDFANRTIVSGGDELEAALGAEQDGENADAFDFDIDDLSEPSGDSAPAEVDADAGLDDGASEFDLPDDASIPSEGEQAAASAEQSDEGLDAELDFELDEDFDFGDEGEADEITTKLELARAYVDMGDEEGAKEILDEVVRDGDDGQKKEAGELLEQIG